MSSRENPSFVFNAITPTLLRDAWHRAPPPERSRSTFTAAATQVGFGRLTDSPGAAPKRYDVYCSLIGEDRVYENVRFVGIRTFDEVCGFPRISVTGFLEIEAENGAWL